MKYKIVAVLWNDHTVFRNFPLKKSHNDSIIPSLTFGVLITDSPQVLKILHHMETPSDEEDPVGDYTIIFKESVINIKEYGEIELAGLE